MSSNISLSTDARGIATLTLNRPERHNAFDDALIAELTDAFRAVGADRDSARARPHRRRRGFSAGGDLNWMRRMAGFGEAENYRRRHGARHHAAQLERAAQAHDRARQRRRLRRRGRAHLLLRHRGGGRGRGVLDLRGQARPRARDHRPLRGRRHRRARGAALCPDRRDVRRGGGAAHRPRPRDGHRIRSRRGGRACRRGASRRRHRARKGAPSGSSPSWPAARSTRR